MNTKEFAKRNGISARTVAQRCRDGMIPLAEQNAGTKRWNIPEEAEMPPCTGRFAAFILENISEREKGNSPQLFPPSVAPKAVSVLRYLLRWGYISGREGGGYAVCARGQRLMQKHRETVEKERTVTTEASAGFEKAGVKVSAGRKTERRIG